MATLNVSRAAGAGSGAAGSGWQRCGGGGSCAAGSSWQRPGLASAVAAAQHIVGSVAASPPWASRVASLGGGGQAAAPWDGAAAPWQAWQLGSVPLSFCVAAGPGQAGSEGSVGGEGRTGPWP